MNQDTDAADEWDRDVMTYVCVTWSLLLINLLSCMQTTLTHYIVISKIILYYFRTCLFSNVSTSRSVTQVYIPPRLYPYNTRPHIISAQAKYNFLGFNIFWTMGLVNLVPVNTGNSTTLHVVTADMYWIKKGSCFVNSFSTPSPPCVMSTGVGGKECVVV